MHASGFGKYLLTFGGGSADFRAAAQRVGLEAELSNCFEKIFVVSETEIGTDFSRFLETNADFI